ncbi:hypothetical protein ACUSIJ_26695 [Pseudochelatococcus sp. B33]
MLEIIQQVISTLRHAVDRGPASVASSVVASPLYTSCQGQVEYPEDDPIFGTYYVRITLELGERGSIPAAIAFAEDRLARDDFPTDDDDALRFWPDLFQIVDDEQRTVLAGQVWGNGIKWYHPVESDSEANEVKEEIERLRAEASSEASWDNHETARKLNLRAAVVEGRLVDPIWRDAVRAALSREA